MTLTEKRWQMDISNAEKAIPADWIWTDPADGWQGIDPQYADNPLVKHYDLLQQVGYANGWI